MKYAGEWRLYINGVMLKDSGAKVGETVSIEIEFDPRPREVPMPAQLSQALKKHPKAKAAFGSLTPSRRKEILRYIGSLKSAATIEKNVARVISELTGSSDAPPIFMGKGSKGY